jgi:hypothetical protein
MNKTPLVYLDKDIKDTLRIVEKRLFKLVVISGGSFSREDIASEAVAAVIRKNLPLHCAFQQACWIRTDKIRSLTCTRKREADGLFKPTLKPTTVSLNNPSGMGTIGSNYVDKSCTQALNNLEENISFSQLLEKMSIPPILRLVLKAMYIDGLPPTEAGAKYNLSASSVCHMIKRWKSEIAHYMTHTGRNPSIRPKI